MYYDKNLESIDDLQVNNLKVIQKKNGFRFGIDSVLLANFVSFRKNDLIVDFCSGSGVIPILLAGKRSARHVTGVEIQKEYAEMASRSVKMNNLTGRVEIIHGDLKDTSILKHNTYDVVTCNPPYKEAKSGYISAYDSTAIARHEIMCNIHDIAVSASRILRFGGKLCLVHRPERMVEIFEAMRKNNIEPKRACMVCPAIGKAPNMVLIEGIKGARQKTLWLPTIFVFDDNGNYTKQINKIYGRDV